MKNIVFFILVTTTLYSSILQEKIISYIPTKEYQINKNLINMLFRDESKFIINGKIRYLKLFKTLKNNGLLDLNLKKPTKIYIEFNILNNSIKGYKILNDSLNSLGYRYFLTDSLNMQNLKQISWTISFKTEYMLDPVVLLNDLQQKYCKITDIKKVNKSFWIYSIDFSNSLIDAIKIDKNEKVKFNKPLSDYFININDTKSLEIKSKKLNRWFPYIVFFNKDLKIIKTIKKDKITKKIKTIVPDNTKYIKITDLYNLINIKRGLTIILR